MISAELETQDGKALLGRARHHLVIPDRPPEDGGQDLGCTSGELMLLSVGSCVVGSMRGYVERNALPVEIRKADVHVEPASVPDGFGRLVVSAQLIGELTPAEMPALIAAAGSGRVVRRFRQGSQIDIRVTICRPDAPEPRDFGGRADIGGCG